MISASELAAIQAEAAKTFDKSGVIYRADRTTDSMGHLAPVWTAQNAGAAIPCSLGRMSGGGAAAEGEELGSLDTWIVQMPVGTDLRQGDRVVVGADTVHIQNVDALQLWLLVLNAMATEVQWAPEDDPSGE